MDIELTEASLSPVGKEFPGHINRTMYSQPQIRQQANVPARMIDGKPTFFVTEIGAQALADKDARMTNETLVAVDPKLLRNAAVGVAEVQILEAAPNPTGGGAPVVPFGDQRDKVAA